jgi:hypothetical protein
VTVTRSNGHSTEESAAQAARFRLVIEAAWDDVPAEPLPEPEDDASAARFRLLDLDD